MQKISAESQPPYLHSVVLFISFIFFFIGNSNPNLIFNTPAYGPETANVYDGNWLITFKRSIPIPAVWQCFSIVAWDQLFG